MRAPSGFNRDRHPGTAALWVAVATLLACGVAGPAHAQQSAPAASSETKSDPPKPSSPQSNMGRIDTQSGGAPASSPQGDSPPGMQPVPSESGPTSRPK
jgi:hypothetical protein